MRFEVVGKRQTERRYLITIGERQGERRYVILGGRFEVSVRKDAVFSNQGDLTPQEHNERWFESINVGDEWSLAPTKVSGR